MSDILIRGMEMPSKENQVLLLTPDGDVWLMADMPCGTKHLAHAKAVELPPHGDLIDRDEYVKSECNNCDGSCECVECDCLNCEQSCRCDVIVDAMEAPVVVPAERREG